MNDRERVGLLSKIHLPEGINGKSSESRPSYTIRCLLKLAFSPTTTSKTYSHKFGGFTKWKNKKKVRKNVIKKCLAVFVVLLARRISLSSPLSALVFSSLPKREVLDSHDFILLLKTLPNPQLMYCTGSGS